MGPTGCGKTEAAIHCAKHLPVELISVDSALVYRGMDVGTAKPEPETLRAYPHHLVDVIDPGESYSAGQFRRDALSLMENITQKGNIPLLVGGTMLYFRVLQQGLAELPTADPELRRQLDDEGSARGWNVLHKRLASLDPEAAKRIHPNDAQRIQRALEVVLSGSSNLSALQRSQTQTDLPFSLIKVCLAPKAKPDLHDGLRKRFNTMINKGFIEEVRALLGRKDVSIHSPAMRAVGYRQLSQFLAGTITRDQAIEDAITATRRLAKRQMTWLRKEKGLTWFDALERNIECKVLSYVSQQLKAFGIPCDTLRP
ncbi:MAG: tRNA (adenosine(37)-N6)-dimethylallyltransferase MiaA [Pseudomonadota bacterium]